MHSVVLSCTNGDVQLNLQSWPAELAVLAKWSKLSDASLLGISRMGEVAGGACWKVLGCLWRMCGWMRLKPSGNVVQIHGKAMQVLQGRSEPPRHSKQPSQPASHPPHLPPCAMITGTDQENSQSMLSGQSAW